MYKRSFLYFVSVNMDTIFKPLVKDSPTPFNPKLMLFSVMYSSEPRLIDGLLHYILKI